MKLELCSNFEAVYDNIISNGVEYVHSSGVKSLVIGLSGGIDSTLSASLGRKVCDLCKIPLIGISIPTDLNKKSEQANAGRASAFCDRFSTMEIGPEARYLAYRLWTCDGTSNDGIEMRLGNIIARLRMIFLYHTAHYNKGLVLSTDNLTEYMLGFWTLHGDVGDLGLIQSLWKTEVYGLAEYLFTEYIAEGRTECAEALFQSIKAVPTDGLGITDSDLDQIEAKSYNEVDDLLISYLSGDTSKQSHPVIQRHLKFAYKRNNPYNIKRENIIT